MPRKQDGSIDWSFVVAALTLLLFAAQFATGEFMSSSTAAAQFADLKSEIGDVRSLVANYQNRQGLDEAEINDLNRRLSMDEAKHTVAGNN